MTHIPYLNETPPRDFAVAPLSPGLPGRLVQEFHPIPRGPLGLSSLCQVGVVKSDFLVGEVQELIGALEPWNFDFPYIGKNHPN
jgi:hypothetical protein